MNEKIQNIIFEILKEIHEESEIAELENPTIDTRLFGANGVLDSLGLVNLITGVEQRISDEFEKDIILADERAMSRFHSPFRTITSLSEYTEKVLLEED